jgi:hypothetical protein
MACQAGVAVGACRRQRGRRGRDRRQAKRKEDATQIVDRNVASPTSASV